MKAYHEELEVEIINIVKITIETKILMYMIAVPTYVNNLLLCVSVLEGLHEFRAMCQMQYTWCVYDPDHLLQQLQVPRDGYNSDVSHYENVIKQLLRR